MSDAEADDLQAALLAIDDTICAQCGAVGLHSDFACAGRVLAKRMAELTAATVLIAEQLEALCVHLGINTTPREKRTDEPRGTP